MLLTRAVSLLSLFVAVTSAELISVSPYIGKHKANCPSGSKLTGALVDGKIYTFGGCYALPYIVNPDDDESDEPFKRYKEHQNVTESSNVYDIASDTWSFETNTPRPLLGSSTIVVNKDIYFYNIGARPRTTDLNLWKYSTDTKTWSEPAQLPNDKMYFMGSQDGYRRNIVRVQNLQSDQWENPIYLDKRIHARKLLCHDTHLSVIGENADKEEDTTEIFHFDRDSVYIQNLINVYHNGSVQVVENFNVTLGQNRYGRRAQVFPVKEWFYIFSLNRSNNATEISKINTVTLETVKLDTLPYALSNVLMVPTENDEIYLFGGKKDNMLGMGAPKGEQDLSVPKIKTYNHKLIITPAVVEEEGVEQADKQQDGHFKLQIPDN
ncbi:hypothetical protein MBANPS3_001759 [Mucor bainieri]